MVSCRPSLAGAGMFVGHYSIAFLAKRRASRVPLWVFLLAVQLVDYLWDLLVLLGVEKFRLAPEITGAMPVDLYYLPYTHSLVATAGWALLAFYIYYRLKRPD